MSYYIEKSRVTCSKNSLPTDFIRIFEHVTKTIPACEYSLRNEAGFFSMHLKFLSTLMVETSVCSMISANPQISTFFAADHLCHKMAAIREFEPTSRDEERYLSGMLLDEIFKGFEEKSTLSWFSFFERE